MLIQGKYLPFIFRVAKFKIVRKGRKNNFAFQMNL